jgi:predicted nicotinamide N-methyase
MSNFNNKDEDFYLSDVHVEIENYQPCDSDSKSKRITRILFELPETQPVRIELDADGDISPPRRPFMSVEHEMSTSLDLVGLQLWRASFYLVDYLFNNLGLIENKCVVDLGAGLGLTSLFVSIFARKVISTDLAHIICQASENFRLNAGLIRELSQIGEEKVSFKELDWFQENLNLDGEFSQATVFIASDVVYDDSITDGFMKVLYNLMIGGVRERKVCIVANERRVNFSSETMVAQDTAYSHFIQCSTELDDFSDTENGFKFKCKPIEIESSEIKQFILNYMRNKFLYLWKIECEPI